jgi:hypothetical protein
VDLASFKMSFIGLRAPGAAGGVADAAVGADALAGGVAGAAGDCACTEDQAHKLKQAADNSEYLKRFN